MEHLIKCLEVGSLRTNCWVISQRDPGGLQKFCAVIDPGSDARLIIDYLKKKNLMPDYILLTHGHFDHVTALPSLAKAFPDAVIAIHREDADYLKSGSPKLLEEGDYAGPLKVIHFPGHTPGSAAFYDEENEVLFSGDTLFYGACGRYDLAGGSRETLRKSLGKIFAMNGNLKVLPGHGPETTIAAEAARGVSYFID